MVTGGYGSRALDSTEIFSDNVWRTVAGTLPAGGLYDLRMATINNKVLIFGIHFLSNKIYEGLFLKVDREVEVLKTIFCSSTMRLNHGQRSEQCCRRKNSLPFLLYCMMILQNGAIEFVW